MVSHSPPLSVKESFPLYPQAVWREEDPRGTQELWERLEGEGAEEEEGLRGRTGVGRSEPSARAQLHELRQWERGVSFWPPVKGAAGLAELQGPSQHFLRPPLGLPTRRRVPSHRRCGVCLWQSIYFQNGHGCLEKKNHFCDVGQNLSIRARLYPYMSCLSLPPPLGAGRGRAGSSNMGSWWLSQDGARIT